MGSRACFAINERWALKVEWPRLVTQRLGISQLEQEVLNWRDWLCWRIWPCGHALFSSDTHLAQQRRLQGTLQDLVLRLRGEPTNATAWAALRLGLERIGTALRRAWGEGLKICDTHAGSWGWHNGRAEAK